jgi:hypothetical protein
MAVAVDLSSAPVEWVFVRELSAATGIPLRTLQRYAERWSATGAVRVERRKAPGARRKWGLWIDRDGAAARLGVCLR